MKLPTATLTFSLCSVIAALGAAQQAPGPPELMGYRLGDTWARIGRAMPCQTVTTEPSRIDSTGRQVDEKWEKWCWPSDTVSVDFANDTLYQVSLFHEPALAGSEPVSWDRHWKAWSIARFGEPDSVTTAHAGDRVEAHWHLKRWHAFVVLSIERTLQSVTVRLCGEVAQGAACEH